MRPGDYWKRQCWATYQTKVVCENAARLYGFSS